MGFQCQTTLYCDSCGTYLITCGTRMPDCSSRQDMEISICNFYAKVDSRGKQLLLLVQMSVKRMEVRLILERRKHDLQI